MLTVNMVSNVVQDETSEAQLVFYDRPDSAGVKLSEYQCVSVVQPENLKVRFPVCDQLDCVQRCSLWTLTQTDVAAFEMWVWTRMENIFVKYEYLDRVVQDLTILNPAGAGPGQ